MTTEMSRSAKAVLVTGASSGIGSAITQELAAHAYHVFAGVRTAGDAAALARLSAGAVTPVMLEVTDADSIRLAVEGNSSELGGRGLAALVNNAGIGVLGPIEQVPIAAARQQFEVNVIGQLAVTRAVLPLLRQGQGRIVNISSVGARVTPPLYGLYSGSKAALE